MNILGVILARAGSKGLPDKCVRDLAGRPVIAYTFDHALAAKCITHVILTTDSEPAKKLARAAGIEVIDRPLDLAGDLATVDAAVRHAVETWEGRHGHASVDHATRPGAGSTKVDVVVILYGNIPVRAEGLIDRAVEQLMATGADSVRSVAPVTKQHPDWIHRLEGDRMTQFRPNSIYRRQDLEPLYYHDGAVIAVTRAALFGALQTPNDHQSFLGEDRRAIVERCDEAVDIDESIDLFVAEAVLRSRTEMASHPEPRALSPRDGEASDHPSFVKPLLKSSGTGQERLSIGSVPIGPRRIGTNEPVFIVAEAGVNHNGSLETAFKLVDAAKQAGADAVKFQMFRAEALASANATTAAYQKTTCGKTSQRDMLRRLELSIDDFAAIKQRCDEKGIIFLATPFGVEEVAALRQLGAPAIKIASTDLTNELLLGAAIDTGLPLIVSTGASMEEEIEQCVARLKECGASERLILLHCVSAYPAPIEALNLRRIAALHERFGVPTGFSDHSTATHTGAWAVLAGACMLEKHFTLDCAQAGPDHAMSLDPAMFAEYVREARIAESAVGTGDIGMSPIEAEVREVARRSVFAARDIAAGDALTEVNLTLKRPGRGLPPTELGRLIGRRAKASIPRDTPLSWELVQ